MKLMITPETDKLFKNACGFAIMTYIGFKANLSKELDSDGCQQGEAVLPEYDYFESVTKKEYNTGLKYILDNGFITIREANEKKIGRFTNNNLIDITYDFQD